MRPVVPALAFVSALALYSLAHADEYVIDGAHTHVGFTISHLGFSETYGVFKNVSGTLTLDEKAPEASKIDVTIQTASLDTADDARDEHVKGKDFLDVATYPTMTFKSTKVDVTGKDMATVTGDLTLHGVTKPVGLIVKLNKAGPSPMDKSRQVAGFSAIGKLKRSDFGITTYPPAIGDEVTLAISTEAVKK
ncbi:MAG: YceI family protein [Parvibaculum sp.]|uniref:YceI family protein n=1 Tax=Parvibaculum sp. TaxID=2024848 RepID=UPI0025E04B02|nr:YceI family protein [Parvibaculum sp.]MCE9649169.1 YceI family protein [Parvibaculum sp.]